MEVVVEREYEDVRIEVPWGYVTGRWYGNRQMRPILALHGWLDNLGTWDTLIPLLPAHIGVLCIDLPGHGRSSKLPHGMMYYYFDYVHIIIRIMKEYNWQKVSLLGHSMGSMICYIYTTLYPHTVDLLIAIDVIKPVYRTPESWIKTLATRIDKNIVEDERTAAQALREPPSYSIEDLERVLYKGSYESVDIENCKYLLHRAVQKSQQYPNKYYFSRDGKVKFYHEFFPFPGLSEEMAKKIRNVPYIVIKGSQSAYINDDSNRVIATLRQNNAHFELHTVEGTHHVHLNNAKEVATLINPFINRHRPAVLSSWTVEVDENKNEKSTNSIVLKKNKRKFLRSKL